MAGVASWGKPGAFRACVERRIGWRDAVGRKSANPAMLEVIAGKSVEGSGCLGIVRLQQIYNHVAFPRDSSEILEL